MGLRVACLVLLTVTVHASGAAAQAPERARRTATLANTTAEIAEELFISDNTVKTHVRHILEKLDASNRAEAVTKAFQLGLIRQDI